MAQSVATLGVDLRTQPSNWERNRGREERNVRFSLTRKNRVFQKSHMRGEEVVEDQLGSCKSVERTSRGYGTHRKVEIEKGDGSSSRQEGVGVAFLVLGSE